MVASIAQSAKDWKGLTKNNLRKYTYLSFIGKCIVASILFGCLGSCQNPPVRPPQAIHDRLDVYELAFHLYFRAEDKEKALEVMRWACREVADGRHISCYNLGLFLEREGLLDEAREAYASSLAIHPTRAARSALDSLAGRGQGKPESRTRLAALRSAEALCRQNKPALALAELKGTSWNRETLTQPFFQTCLGAEPGYRAMAAQAPSQAVSYDEVLRLKGMAHPLGRIVDMAPYLRAESLALESNHPVNRTWKAFLDSTRAGNARGMELNLAAFFSALDRIRLEKPAEAQAVLALKRAAGTLIAQDIFFAAPRRLPGIRKLVQAQIPDAGFFPGD